MNLKQNLSFQSSGQVVVAIIVLLRNRMNYEAFVVAAVVGDGGGYVFFYIATCKHTSKRI